MVDVRRAQTESLSLAWWLAGLGAISGAVALFLWLIHVTPGDEGQQLALVKSLMSGDLVHAFGGGVPAQTSGPGFGLFALPIFAFLRVFVSDHTAYVTASLACLIPLAWSVMAASRATGVVRRSGRELAYVAVVVLGTSVMANYFEALHPADVLATAACLGAFAALANRRVAWAFVLLGFALATRQWAVLALAVLATLERGDARRDLVVGSVGVATVLVLPFFIANTSQTLDTFAAESVGRGPLAAMSLFDISPPLARLLGRTLPLLGTAALCAWLLLRRVTWSPEVAVAALAVAFLIRPPFDPAGYLYYAAPGYAFFVLMSPRRWRWLAAAVAGSAALLLRYSLRLRYPYARFVSVRIVLLPYRASGVALSIATTAIYVAALVAALIHLRTLVNRDDQRSVPSPLEV